VPLLVVTPFLVNTPGTVDHTQRSTAILRFVEQNFGVSKGTLGTLDNQAGNDDLTTLVNPDVSLTQPPPTPAVAGFPPATSAPTCPASADKPAEPND
jgi:hypothetical protein